MGSISAGVGLISGIDTASLIDQLISLQARGKASLQQRLATLQAQQTAMLDVNARMLNFKGASEAFRSDEIFGSALATSTNEGVLTANASTGAATGSYSLLVHQLVTTSQKMTGGFADRDATALGLDSLAFELGRGKVEQNAELATLNGGDGVRRGRIVITDTAGTAETIDLSTAATINDVVEAINSAALVNVAASVDGDRLVVADNAGGAGTLSISNATGDFTATDLGIAAIDGGAGDSDATADGTITGAQVSLIGDATSLRTLNDGNGVQVSNGLDVADFRITDRNGVVHDIVLGQRTDGQETDTAVKTIQGVIDRINDITGGDVTASIASDGVSIQLTDNTGGGGNFIVAGGVNGEQTARDLGILNSGVSSSTIDGERILAGMNTVLVKHLRGGNSAFTSGEGALAASTPLANLFQGAGITTNGNGSSPDIQVQDRTGATYDIELDGLTTVQDLIDAFDATTGSAVTLAIDGQALVATNNSTGPNNFQISDINGAQAATELGIVADLDQTQGESVTGSDTQPLADFIIDITNRNGVLTSVDISSADTVTDIINAINDSGAGVSASLNGSGNGLKITDTTGGSGNLIIQGGGAAEVGIETDVAGVDSGTVNGSNLQFQYVTGSTLLDDLNYGRGIGAGSFRIVDANGAQATVEVTSSMSTLQQVTDAINSQGIDINARINDQGDGIALEDTSSAGSLAIRVENVNGTAANDLRILGEASDSENANFIDGSYEVVVDLDTTDTLNEVISKVNGADVPVSASVINTGDATRPYRITFSSGVTGTRGDLIIDTFGEDIGLTTLSEAQDARVFFGSDDPADGLLVTSTDNTLDDLLDDVTIDLHASSSSPVQLNITRDDQAIVDAVKNFVTTFNDVVGRIDQYDRFDQETETKGPLFGNPTVARLRAAMFRQLQDPALNVDDQFQFLTSAGISVASEGKGIEIDETKLREAMEEDFEAVAALFAAHESTVTNSTEVVDGVTVDETEETFDSLGVAELFAQLGEQFTNSIDGVLKIADENFTELIDQTNDRITAFDERLARERERLQRQFTAMETALAQLQGQQGALASLSAAAASSGLQFGL